MEVKRLLANTLSTALTILAAAYKNQGLIAQISIAGNNAQSVTPAGRIQLGNEKEPLLLHGHMIGRGNLASSYIGNVPLKGPAAGHEMNLRGDGKILGVKYHLSGLDLNIGRGQVSSFWP